MIEFSVAANAKLAVFVTGVLRAKDPVNVVKPTLLILIRSVGDAAPSAVVENTRRPGMSFVPGVPSTSVRIDAALMKDVPSEPAKKTAPMSSPLVIMVCVPTVSERDFARVSAAGT